MVSEEPGMGTVPRHMTPSQSTRNVSTEAIHARASVSDNSSNMGDGSTTGLPALAFSTAATEGVAAALPAPAAPAPPHAAVLDIARTSESPAAAGR